MRGKLINPWQCPPNHAQCRLLQFENLPPGCSWRDLYQYFTNFQVEHQNIFGHKALAQFVAPQHAQAFYETYHDKMNISGYPINISFSPLIQLILSAESPTRTAPSRVICIQVMKLRVCLGIQDIFDECAQFGIVEKIICFEKTGKFALVQMSTVEQASLVLVNLSNSPRHLPAFQFRVQYSKNQDIVIKFNNSKSFDFTQPDAFSQFSRMRESTAGERPFFVVDDCPEIDPIFDFWRPVHFDPTFTPVVGVSNYDDKTVSCDFLYNLFSQYGPIRRIKIPYNTNSNYLNNNTNRKIKFAFIMFANGFYARLALTFLNNCPNEGKKLIVDFPNHPDILSFVQQQNQQFSLSSQNQTIGCDLSEQQYFKEYTNEFEDFEIEDYANLSFPSQCVKIKSGDINKILLPVDVAYHPNNKVLHFKCVDDATRFIGLNNNQIIDGQQILLSFCPPD